MLNHIAFRNTLKNWRHSLSALLSLSASFISLVIFDGYIHDLDRVFTEAFRQKQMLGDVFIENMDIFSKDGISEPWKFWITPDEQKKIDEYISTNSSSLQHVQKNLNFQGMASSGQQSFIFLGRGYNLIEGQKMRGDRWDWNSALGIPLDRSANPFSMLSGIGLAKKLGCQIPEAWPFLISEGFFPHNEESPLPSLNLICRNSQIQLSTSTAEGQLNAIDVELVGVTDGGYKDIDDRFLHTSLEAAQTLMNTQSITYYSVLFKKDSTVDAYITKFNETMSTINSKIKMTRWQIHPAGEPYRKTMEFLGIFKNFIIIVILIVSTLSVVNTMVKIVKERTREIGTLRSLGYRRLDILKLFIYESFYLAIIGSVIGTISSWILNIFINLLKIKYKAGMLSNPVLFKIEFVPKTYLLAFGLLVFISFVASLFSTLSILKGRVVENLQST